MSFATVVSKAKMRRKKEVSIKRKSVFRNTLVEYTYTPNKKQKKDVEMFLIQQNELLENTLKKLLKNHTNIKFDIYTQTELGKFQFGEKNRGVNPYETMVQISNANGDEQVRNSGEIKISNSETSRLVR